MTLQILELRLLLRIAYSRYFELSALDRVNQSTSKMGYRERERKKQQSATIIG